MSQHRSHCLRWVGSELSLLALLLGVTTFLGGCQQLEPPATYATRGLPGTTESSSGAQFGNQCLSNNSSQVQNSGLSGSSCATNQNTTTYTPTVPQRAQLLVGLGAGNGPVLYPPFAADPRVEGRFCTLIFGEGADGDCIARIFGFTDAGPETSKAACVDCLLSPDPYSCIAECGR